MKNKNYFLNNAFFVFIFFSITFSNVRVFAAEPDSAYIFAYAANNGLSFAWSMDKENWHPIGSDYTFLRCDYGRWDTEKRMYTPFLFYASDGLWHCVWSVNDNDGIFAHAASKDLINWQKQSYPTVMQNAGCFTPTVIYNNLAKDYTITWLSNINGTRQPYSTTTKDFKNYTPTKKIMLSGYKDLRQTANISNRLEKGTMHKVAWNVIKNLINTQQLTAYKDLIWHESTKEDAQRFSSLETVDASISIEASKSKKISNKLFGVFFEDINYAADGGLYAELIQNRDFEYALIDKDGQDSSWNSSYAWKLVGNTATFSIDTVSPIHPNNKHYAVLQINKIGTGLINEGFDGIPVKAGEKYNFSLFARTRESNRGKLIIRLIGKDGTVYGEAVTNPLTSDWKKQKAVIIAKQTVSDASLEVIPQMTGKINLDMISLFPQNTFKNRKNGLRADLAQAIADIKPKFVRFPGGCVAHGDGLENIYRWKNTIGPLESRKPQRNIWGYHQTVGLGYFEYLQFCEDIGAEAVPIIAAGVPCQNSERHDHPIGGQQGGIPMNQMAAYIQDIIDLVEYANGDVHTKWGKLRAESGHPKPFGLKYIGIGNEDEITDIFEERFTMIYKALKKTHPEITIIGTVGPTHEGTDYREGWAIANKLNVPIVDEHYYESPSWFINNQDFYDKYDRSKSKVYLGEYAAQLPGRPSNMETALSEAIYMIALERNGDVVSMASYAPLLAKEGHTQWKPDMIYFDNTKVKTTSSYQVQKLFGHNSGNEYLCSTIRLSDEKEDIRMRIAFSAVRDSASNDLILKMVNLLPVSVHSKLDLNSAFKTERQAIRIEMNGKPEDSSILPIKSVITVSPNYETVLAPYSFTLIRIKSVTGTQDSSKAPNKNNPVLKGYYADPEIMYSHKTHKYYIYPTSDGFPNWSGSYFKAFSSTNLKNWKDEGIILDLKKDVSWAHQNAWAPCIIEKKIKGQYKYFYYFAADNKIGVAVGDDPAGPFTDSGKPLILSKPDNIGRGQQIDPDVFEDPKTGKTYLYWGNGYMAVAELNNDMMSLKPGTQKVLIASSPQYNEGSYVFYRKGIYYFSWSKNDTRSEDYQVRYVTAASPVGPIDPDTSKILIQKNSSKGIYATGHHSILKVEGKDEWYIVYHRFNRPNGINMGEAAGYNREVCIDKMFFNKDGSIKEVVPTL